MEWVLGELARSPVCVLLLSKLSYNPGQLLQLSNPPLSQALRDLSLDSGSSIERFPTPAPR